MININIILPDVLLSEDNTKINYDSLKNKTIIGLCGYARSGKDTIGKKMVENYNYKRVAFGDALKKDLDKHMRNLVYEDLKQNNINIDFGDIEFLNPKNIQIKEILRPYMIWFGEEMKKITGVHCWVNKAITEMGIYDKIILTDIRRENEIAIFSDNMSMEGFNLILIHVNQYKLKDNDILTLNTIRKAQEDWLFKHTIYVDSKISENARESHINSHIFDIVNKFPDFFI